MQSPNKSALSHRDQADDIRPLTVQEQPDLGPFKISPQQLQQIFHLNTRRSTCEELDYLIQQGGVDWLIDGLQTSIKHGINDDHNQRIQIYGHNKRIVRPPQTYCELLWNALEDFTMRVLL